MKVAVFDGHCPTCRMRIQHRVSQFDREAAGTPVHVERTCTLCHVHVTLWITSYEGDTLDSQIVPTCLVVDGVRIIL